VTAPRDGRRPGFRADRSPYGIPLWDISPRRVSFRVPLTPVVVKRRTRPRAGWLVLVAGRHGRLALGGQVTTGHSLSGHDDALGLFLTPGKWSRRMPSSGTNGIHSANGAAASRIGASANQPLPSSNGSANRVSSAACTPGTTKKSPMVSHGGPSSRKSTHRCARSPHRLRRRVRLRWRGPGTSAGDAQSTHDGINPRSDDPEPGPYQQQIDRVSHGELPDAGPLRGPGTATALDQEGIVVGLS